MKKILIIFVILVFSAVTAIPILEYGLMGFLKNSINNSGSFQIFIDLVIASGLVIIWMFHDAKKNGLPRIPYIVFTVIAGSFGSLFYLLHRQFILDKRAENHN